MPDSDPVAPAMPAPEPEPRLPVVPASVGVVAGTDRRQRVPRPLFDPPTVSAEPSANLVAMSAGLEAMQQELLAVKRERDSLRERAGMLTQELRHAHAHAIDAGAELHELRRRVESQRTEEVNTPMPSLAGLDEAAR